MKKNLSVLGLFARSTFYPILMLLGILTLADTGLYLWAAGHTPHAPLLEQVLEDCHFGYPLALVFVLIVLLLCATGAEVSSRQGYTLRRLGISEYRVFLIQAGYNTFCFFLLGAWPVLVVYLLCRVQLLRSSAEYVSSQTLMLAFYRDDFLHNLMPLADILRWLRNGALIPALGISCAYFPLKQRQRKYSALPVMAAALAVMGFSYGVSDASTDAVFLFLLIAIPVAAILLAKEVTKHEEA